MNLTDDEDQYIRRERARWRFFKKIEDRQCESSAQEQELSGLVETPAGESFPEG